MSDNIRVLRLYEFIGPRDLIERQVNMSIHGQKTVGKISIRATTLGEFAESLQAPSEFKFAPATDGGTSA